MEGQRDEKRTGNGGGRQELKHVDGDFPWCMRRKGEDNEAKTRENENSRGKGGGRQKLRHVDGDVALSMRSKQLKKIRSRQQQKKTAESKQHAVAKICAAAKQEKKTERVPKHTKKDITSIVVQKIRDQ